MRPVSIPEHLIDDTRVRRTVTVPDHLLAHHVEPLDALIDQGPDGLAQVHVRIELEPGDLARMRSTGELWVTFLGGVAPFRLSTTAPGEGH